MNKTVYTIFPKNKITFYKKIAELTKFLIGILSWKKKTVQSHRIRQINYVLLWDDGSFVFFHFIFQMKCIVY